MEFPFITSLSALWFIYSLFLIEINNVLNGVFKNLILSLSVLDPEKGIDQVQLNILQTSFTADTVIAFKEIQEVGSQRYLNIKSFESFVVMLSKLKSEVTVNIVMTTLLVCVGWFFSLSQYIAIALILSLLHLLFYYSFSLYKSKKLVYIKFANREP